MTIDSTRDHAGKLILASSSPRRHKLLAQAGYVFDVLPSPFDEPHDFADDVSPANRAEASSYFKARSVARLCTDEVVLAADTVVALGSDVFGKPGDVQEARRILSELAGTTHLVITGVTLFDAGGQRRFIGHDTTRVSMRPMDDDALDKYLAGNEWREKAGAYGIQDRGDAFIERIEGSFTNVVGLPMELVSKLLTDWGIRPTTKTRAAPHEG